MASRHQSRELAVQFVYKWSIDPARIGQAGDIETFWREQAWSDNDNRPFFEMLARGVAEFLPQIDAALEGSLENWRMDRIDKVDLAILRVSIFELLFSNVAERPDAPVIINEAIEMSKKFGGADSSSFINGILDNLRKKNLSEPR